MKTAIEILADMTKRDMERLSIPSSMDPGNDGMTVPLINRSNRMRKARIARKHDRTVGQPGHHIFPSEEAKVSPLVVIIKK